MCDLNFLHVSFPHGVAQGSSHPLHLRLWHHQHVGRPLFMTLLSNVPCDLITKQIIETLEQGVGWRERRRIQNIRRKRGICDKRLF